MIVIDEDGDLTIKVVEYYDETTRSNDRESANQKPTVCKTEYFQVCRHILVSNSLVFKQLLASNFAEATQSTVVLKEDAVDTMELWFRLMHKTVKGHTYNVPLSEMWHIVAAAEKYDLNIHDMNEWFAEWYERNSSKYLDYPRQLLYPCYLFDHANGFAQATKSLAYNSLGHIVEFNPTEHYELHLPSRIIQQLNAAKGRLRTMIHKELFKPNESLLRATCTCKEKTLYGYEKALYDIDVWPLERVAQSCTMTKILDRLDQFTYKPPRDACISCRKDFGKIARDAQLFIRRYFDGLCLDCMSMSKTGDMNEDYWVHNELREYEIISGCRFKHTQATWYFSFMGRKEERDHFQKLKRHGG